MRNPCNGRRAGASGRAACASSERPCGHQKTDWFNRSWSINIPKRYLLGNAIFKYVGKMSWVEPPLHVSLGKNTTVGDHCYLNYNTTLLDDWTITIGDHVLIAPNVIVSTATHPLPAELRSDGETLAGPVAIEDGVWIGAGAIVLPGVTIGKGSVIGAGSIVTKDVPPNTLALGVPCKVVREIGDGDRELYRAML
jgi:galactoside O-acetyltransferase